jgi:histone deacetylase 1/2
VRTWLFGTITDNLAGTVFEHRASARDIGLPSVCPPFSRLLPCPRSLTPTGLLSLTRTGVWPWRPYSTVLANNTWDLLPRPPHANVVTDKWVFKYKFKADGSLERYKARWVLCGFTQRPNVVFAETFSPVVKPASVRIVLSLALSRSWPIHQLDVNNAFLQGTLSETMYCAQPPGFENFAHPDCVCRLNRSLYGPKQAPRAWYN